MIVLNLISALFAPLAVRGLIQRAEVWEARIAANIDHRLVTFAENRGKEKRSIRYIIFVISLSYYIVHFPMRLVYSALLVSLYFFMRLVFPVFFLWFVISFGISSCTSLFHWILFTFRIEQITLLNATPSQVLSNVFPLLLMVVYATIYIALVLVIIIKYRQTFFDPNRN